MSETTAGLVFSFYALVIFLSSPFIGKVVSQKFDVKNLRVNYVYGKEGGRGGGGESERLRLPGRSISNNNLFFSLPTYPAARVTKAIFNYNLFFFDPIIFFPCFNNLSLIFIK